MAGSSAAARPRLSTLPSLLLPTLLGVLLGSAAPAAAQAGNPPPTLEVTSWLDPPRVAVAPGWTTIPTAWQVTFANPALASAALADGQARLTWAIVCPAGADIRLDNATTPVPYEPGASGSAGVAGLRLQAQPGTRGMEGLPCTLRAAFVGGAGSSQADAVVAVQPVVDFVDGLSATAPTSMKLAGPQKTVPFAIELDNAGNSRIKVSFAMDPPPGHWNAILPEVVLLEPGQQATAIFTVATPFQNGYNSEGTAFVVRALPVSDVDPNVMGAPRTVEVDARVQGWYAPGPSPLLALGALAAAALALRRRS